MSDDVAYLLSLQAVRDRASKVGEEAAHGRLNHFDVHEDKLDDVAEFVSSVIKRDYGPDKYDSIPPHGRWQHFEVGGVPRVKELIDDWTANGCDKTEVTRRLIDLFFVSVLLDAGAGDTWRWTEPGTLNTYERSEGIAVASLFMFKKLSFAAPKDAASPKVNGLGLQHLTNTELAEGFQSTDDNMILGLESRADLLRNLGKSLLNQKDIFDQEGRPGSLVDYLQQNAHSAESLDVLVLWQVLQGLLINVWPKDRAQIEGRPLGDAWPLRVLDISSTGTISAESIAPFHKLTQWLTYSLMVPFERVLGLSWRNADKLTALPEYRNGGLFVDLGVLQLKDETMKRGRAASNGPLPLFTADDDAIVEWRAMTLVLVDKLYSMILGKFEGVELSMAQLLESGTWKSGREMAAKMRPDTKSSPILIKSDGTVF